MIVIVCIDDNKGMMFNHRRQSRDIKVYEDIAAMVGENRLYMNEYSYKLFEGLSLESITVDSEFLQQAEIGEYCFVEDVNVLPFIEKIEKVILYWWNRHYPTDFYLDLPLDGWILKETTEFEGNSHERIKKEIYISEEKI